MSRTNHPTFVAWVGIVALGVLAGCAQPVGMAFPEAMVNGRPARLALDSGAARSWLFSPAANRLGLEATPLPRDPGALGRAISEPVRIDAGTQEVTTSVTVFQVPWVARLTLPFARKRWYDGSLGWLAARDNILVFDPGARTVRRVDRVPAEAAGWLRLGVPYREQFFIEIPADGGKPLRFLVDTGDPGGVTLGPELWAAWRAAHPGVATRLKYAWFLGREQPEGRETADHGEVALGALVLRDVPVTRQSEYERERLGGAAGTLGLQALARLHLIVDARRGVAYARHNAAPAEPDAQAWAIDASVRLDARGDLAYAAYQTAEAKALAGDFTGAIADYSRALEHDARNVLFYAGRAEARQRQGDLDGAIADAERGLALAPEAASLHLVRGAARIGKGDTDGAVRDLERALTLDPENGAAHLFLALVAMQAGDFETVLARTDRAAVLDPGLADIHKLRGAVRLAQTDYVAATAEFAQALARHPGDAATLGMRAAARLGLGDGAGAIADSTRSLALDPARDATWLVRAHARHIAGEFAAALEDYEQVIALSPSDSAEARIFRHVLLRRAGRADDGFKENLATWRDDWRKTTARFLAGDLDEAAFFSAAIAADVNDHGSPQSEACYFAGLVRSHAGDKPGARELWEHGVALEAHGTITHQLARAELARLAAVAMAARD